MDTELPDGLVLRTAGPADLPGASRLLAARGEPADAVDLELVVGTTGGDGVAVVVDGDRVVCTLTLLDEVVHIGRVAVPTGQVELVATDPEHEGRGLTRALMAWAHDRSRERGHLLQVMVGIPYFYRQFGYEYVAPIPAWRRLDGVPHAADDVEVRPATPADIPAMAALQLEAQAAADVRMGHSEECWQWLVERDGSEQWIAERNGTPVGVSRTQPQDEPDAVAELAAIDDAAAHALLAHAAARTGQPLEVRHGAPTPPGVEALLAAPTDLPDWFYGRVDRLGPLLAHLAPVLVERLEAAGLAGQQHEVLLSTWRRHLRFTIGPAGFRLVSEGGPEQAPISKGGSGVPPDAVASLLLGPHGALQLEQRLPDFLLGDQRVLMAALFPPVVADLSTFYVP
jgi:GNAT superfamily N-acetyltransferase